MKTENNSKKFTNLVWWLTVLFTLATFLVYVPLLLDISNSFISSILLPTFFEIFLFFILGTLPTYWILLILSDFFFKKPITNRMLRIELLIWIVPIFTLNLWMVSQLILNHIDFWDLISAFYLSYVCLFCFILSFKIEREKRFVKTKSVDNILDDDLDLKK